MNRLGWPLGLVAMMSFVALLAPWIAPHDPNAQNLLKAMQVPFTELEHPLGTDELGRDAFSQMLFGLRVSIMVGFLGAVISSLIGLPLGLIAGLRGGKLEAIIMRAVEVQLALPTTLLALVTLALLGRGLEKIIFVIGVFGWAIFARIARAAVLSQRSREYVLAATALGVSDSRLLWRHVLPNVAGTLLVQFTLDIPRNISLEAALSFLGLGVGVDTPSLGAMVARGQAYLFSGSWWLSLLPGLVITALVLCVNWLADALRYALDPKRS